MEQSITCCFTGHRRLPINQIEHITQNLNIAIDHLIDQGIKNFISGGALGFDQLAASVVLEKRAERKDIRLILALPCRDQDKLWNVSQCENYQRLISASDNIVYVSDNYFNGCMRKRNYYMVDSSAYCICASIYPRSGTMQTVRYAQTKGVHIINVAK